MKKAVKSCLVLAMVFAFGVTSAQAATTDRKRARDRDKDRSCQSYTAPIDGETFSLAAQNRSRSEKGSRLRNGSCRG